MNTTFVGTKSDLKNAQNIVNSAEGEIIKRKINANVFIECSAKDYVNINEVIYEAVRAATNGIPEIEQEQSFCNCCWIYYCMILIIKII